MKILILSRQTIGGYLGEAWKFQLSKEGYTEVDYGSKLDNTKNNLSQYGAVIAHPVPEDLQDLYNEANNRKDFKLIFFRTASLAVDTSEFKNNNVFFKDFLTPSELVNIINEGV